MRTWNSRKTTRRNMTWFDIKYGGQTYVENVTGGNEKSLVALGFHGYATQAQAVANPNSANAGQMLFASNILAGNPTGGVNTPSPPGTSTVAGAGAAAAGAVNPLSYLGNIGDFFYRLTQGATWLRVGEVAVGILLIYVGVKASTTSLPTAGKAAAGHVGKQASVGNQVIKGIAKAIVIPK